MMDFSTRGRTALEGLNPTEWENLWKKLRFYTYKNFGSRVNGRVNLLDEVILEAIEDTFFGNRRLPPHVDLTAFLCETIRSKIGHFLEKEKRGISIEEFKGSPQEIHLTRSFGNSKLNPQRAERAAEAYQIVEYGELCSQIREAARPDPSLLQLAELLCAVPDLKPREIASQMNQPIKNVLNLLRRLGRRARKLQRD